ncbi:DDB1- and CUL4-associated factor 7-like [Notamacropus eugenii]|uniref:DDB1- and CUL4-associated factor 7-like n=1 Tax=Notamacropus eugenii TaxID=9315 RepID=UPI003B6829C6
MSWMNYQFSRKDHRYRRIYRYEAPWTVYAMNWSVRADQPFRLALGSFIEDYENKVQVVRLASDWVDTRGDIVCNYTLQHPYPPTKIMWIPDPQGIHPDLLATSADHLRVWRCLSPCEVIPAASRARGSIHRVQVLGGSVSRGRGRGSVFRGRGSGIISTTAASTVPATAFDLDLQLECLLNHNENSTPFFSPLTSFDWNATDPCILVTSCIDTTCTIWALETSQVLGQVSGHQREHFSSHNKEVYDVAFGGGRDVFASVSADGSLRLFDLRRLHHSTIVYQEPRHLPLLRLAWNKQDLNYLATLAMDSTEVAVLDLRMPGSPVARLNRHRACVNGLTWAPNSAGHICTASDDYQALIWNIQQMPQDVKNPILTHTTNGAINNVQWAAIQTDWIAMCYNNFLELLRVQGPDLG